MLNEPTNEKLRALKLTGMADAWVEQQRSAEAQRLSFDERLGILVDAECLLRQNKRLARALKAAKLKIPHACIEDIDYAPKREIDKAVIRQLATCRWIDEHLNVLVSGATGTGKSYIGCALAQLACRRGYRATYRRASRLYNELELARGDGTYADLLERFARFDVLVIDDFALSSIGDDERRDLNEVLEDRCGSRSTVVTSQLPPGKWHEYLVDPTLADAICDRVIPNSHRIVLKGPSRRPRPKATEANDKP